LNTPGIRPSRALRAGRITLLLGSEVQLRHTNYDLPAAAERIGRTNYPQARDFAARHVLEPPTEREMLDTFSHVEFQ
jgi:hypothetical protein